MARPDDRRHGLAVGMRADFLKKRPCSATELFSGMKKYLYLPSPASMG
jgi:hypothetical protein